MFDTAETGTKLALDGVTSGYGPIAIIKDLSLQIRKGEIFALMGKNGMGKTTLLKTILGLVPARAGGYPARRPVDRPRLSQDADPVRGWLCPARAAAVHRSQHP